MTQKYKLNPFPPTFFWCLSQLGHIHYRLSHFLLRPLWIYSVFLDNNVNSYWVGLTSFYFHPNSQGSHPWYTELPLAAVPLICRHLFLDQRLTNIKASGNLRASVPAESHHSFSLFSFLASEAIWDFSASYAAKSSFISQVPEQHPELLAGPPGPSWWLMSVLSFTTCWW